MNLAPVIVFAYDRPEHLRRTLEALAKNTLAKESMLYVLCDGAKSNASPDQLSRINRVREVAKETVGFKEIHVECANQNKGLANSIIGGVTDVINKHGRVIVLEDDLLTSPYFLKYMNEGLEYYQNRPSVYSLGGYNFPPQKMQIPKDYEYDTYVSLRFCSWGWAMWKDRWDTIDWSFDYLDDFLKNPKQIEAFNRGGSDLTNMLLLQRNHKIDSWAIRCAYNQFANHAVTILPCRSYVDNIGLDGSGVHCADMQNINQNELDVAPKNPRWLDVLYEDMRIINAFYAYCNPIKLPIWKKVVRKIYRIAGWVTPASVEPKVYM